ncbi:hypothetical protein B296_00028361 [Ensete ventricosum]|uniref:Uncharacterized protein n=1 Tax=Ensete ventricosum TaxID=4639 RepID=A0A426YNY8_ENSVE|nr:hypothetical protein B296_00028361 [Ensete ventricosum]
MLGEVQEDLDGGRGGLGSSPRVGVLATSGPPSSTIMMREEAVDVLVSSTWSEPICARLSRCFQSGNVELARCHLHKDRGQEKFPDLVPPMP